MCESFRWQCSRKHCLEIRKTFQLSKIAFWGSCSKEMIIAENGPLIYHADKILDRAMEKYCKEHIVNGKWRFLRNTHDIRTYSGNSSKVVGKLAVQTSFYANMRQFSSDSSTTSTSSIQDTTSLDCLTKISSCLLFCYIFQYVLLSMLSVFISTLVLGYTLFSRPGKQEFHRWYYKSGMNQIMGLNA